MLVQQMAAIQQRFCTVCTETREIGAFNGGRNVCTRCRNKQAADRAAAKIAAMAEAGEELVRKCNGTCGDNGSGATKPLSAFEGNRKMCTTCRTRQKAANVAGRLAKLAQPQPTTENPNDVDADGERDINYLGDIPEQCIDCNCPFSPELFTIRTDTKRYRPQCNACRAMPPEYHRKRRADEKAADPDTVMAKRAEEAQAYRNLHPEYVAKMIDRRRTNPITRFAAIKAESVKRGKPWAEEDDVQLAKLLMEPCHYCGITSTENNDSLSGLDRVGYSISNVVPCCTMCNMMKRELNYSDFIAKCTQIATFSQMRVPFEPITTPTDKPSGHVQTYRQPRRVHQPESQGRRVVFYHSETMSVARVCNTVKEAGVIAGYTYTSTLTCIRNVDHIWVKPCWKVRNWTEQDEIDAEAAASFEAALNAPKKPFRYFVILDIFERNRDIQFNNVRDIAQYTNLNIAVLNERLRNAGIGYLDYVSVDISDISQKYKRITADSTY
jgi:hypothetical protein